MLRGGTTALACILAGGCIYDVAPLVDAGAGGATSATGTSASGTTSSLSAGGDGGERSTTSSATTTGIEQPVCGDGTLDPNEECDDANVLDGDGCSASCAVSGTDCSNAIPVAVALGPPTAASGTISGPSTMPIGAGVCETGLTAGGERVYVVAPPDNGFLTVSVDPTSTTFNSGIYVLSDCTVAPLACDSDSSLDLQGGESISFPVVADVTYYIVVDSSIAGASGPFTLSFDLSHGRDCSDPIPISLPQPGRSQLYGGSLSKTDAADETLSCGVATGPDLVYALNFGFADTLTFAPVGGDFTTNMELQSSCGGAPLACDFSGASIVQSVTAGQTAYLWMKSPSTLFTGNFGFNIN